MLQNRQEHKAPAGNIGIPIAESGQPLLLPRQTTGKQKLCLKCVGLQDFRRKVATQDLGAVSPTSHPSLLPSGRWHWGPLLHPVRVEEG